MHRAWARSPSEAVLSTLEDPSSSTAAPEAVLGREENIEGRSLSQIAWGRLRRDKVALAGGLFIVFLVLVALPAPADHQDHGRVPSEYHTELLDPRSAASPTGPSAG